MSYRAAAESAYALVCGEDPDLAWLGVRIITDLANHECYLARLYMMYLHDDGRLLPQDSKSAQLWMERARAMHLMLFDANDLYDAGMKCQWDPRFMATEAEAISLWERAALQGHGPSLYAICDVTRNRQKDTLVWRERLASAAKFGSTEAMVELAEQEGVRGTASELLWLRAAAALGSLRATEILG